jgi:DNA-binding LacI/PurR family transcriptional regulator
VAHLASLGRRRIAHIAGPSDMNAGVDRLGGYEEGLASAGLAVDRKLIATGDFTYDAGANAMRRLLELRSDLDAVFAASDMMAAGAMATLRAAGRRVPDDVAVVGFDDAPIAVMTDPPLTSVRQPIEEMGREMARLLLVSIGQRDTTPRHVILATRLVRRASTDGGRRR